MTTKALSSRLRRTASHWGAFEVEVANGRMVRVHPFAKDTNPSPVLHSVIDSVYSEARVRQPMVRAGYLKNGPRRGDSERGSEPFVPLSWEKACDLVAGELQRVKDRYGNTAIFGGSYGWASAGRFHQANAQLYRFLNLFGGFTEKWDSYSFAAGTVLANYIVGSADCVVGHSTSWASIAENCELMVLFGGLPLKNMQMEYGGLGHHATVDWLARLKAAGVSFVSFGLADDDTPDVLEAERFAPRPSSDTAVMLGLAHSLVAEDLHDKAFLAQYCIGFERFLPYLMGESDGVPKDAKWAAKISGIPAEAIRSLARRMAAKRTMISVAWSLQRAEHGEQPYWMAITLAAMLGQIGLPGTGFGFGYGCESCLGAPRQWIPIPTLPIGKNATGSGIPVARISDMLLNPGASYDYRGEKRTYPDIRLVYWCGGNPFHHHQDINRLLRAWQQPETIIVHEPWWTATARHADIVLPATTPFERQDIAASSRDRFVLAMDQVIEPLGEARDDHRIFCDIARHLGFEAAFTEGRGPEEWIRHLYARFREAARLNQVDVSDFDSFWEQGYVEIPEPTVPHVLFEDFRRDPLHHPLKTPSGRIEIYSETIAGFGYDDCPPHPVWLEPSEWLGSPMARQFPLHLISNQPRGRLHGQLDDGAISRGYKIKGREPLWIHPEDAAARGIADGDLVRVFNRRGDVLAGALVTTAIRPGVIQLATGATYDPLVPGQPGTLDKHGNANVLTLDKGTSRLAQAPSAHSCLVEVARFEAEAPPVTAFVPPRSAAGPG